MSTPQPAISFPQVTDESVKGFARAWDRGGIKMILDGTSIQFAKDFANTALKSYVIDLMNKAQQLKAAKEQAPQAIPVAPPQANSAPEKPKGSIILTD